MSAQEVTEAADKMRETGDPVLVEVAAWMDEEVKRFHFMAALDEVMFDEVCKHAVRVSRRYMSTRRTR